NYIADTSFNGHDSFKYSIRYVDKPWLYSEPDTVHLFVNKNPDCPVGVEDYGEGISAVPISIDVLANDYDPNGDGMEIMDVKVFTYASSAYIEGDNIVYTSAAYTIGKDSIRYRVRQINDPNYFSDWISVYFNINYNPEFPFLINDSVTTKGGVPVTINVLQNDIIADPSLYELTLFQPGPSKGIRSVIDSSLILYTPFMNSAGQDSFCYALRVDTFPHYMARGTVYIDIIKNHAYDSLTINNINAGFHSSGFQFSSGNEILGQGVWDYNYHFEVPKGSGKHTFFTHNIWFGGFDNNDSLHLAGERYKQMGSDFQPGPVSNQYDSAYKYNWYGLWMLYREEVGYHINNWWKEGYEPIRSIAEWPGNGNTSNGQAEQLAPYYDKDNNGYYDPMMGDYPLIRGDQCIYFIYNDDLVHTETNGERLKLEIHGMGYAFDAPDDSILNNTIFAHFDLINRSGNTYSDCYFGIFADMDLGYAWDDYVGSYVKGSSFYSYNGTPVDGNGEPEAYGENPPSQSVTILAGPFMDPDMEDNPDGGCDFSVTGKNFGNGIVDDERYGLTRFTYFNNAGGPQGDPTIAPVYYNYLTGYWKDETPVVFGGNGYHPNWEEWSLCKFMWPDDSDPLNWGTDCELPIGGFNQNGNWWTEILVNNPPSDRRGMGSCGPFTFHPGDVQEVEVAYIYANSFNGPDSSKKLLFSYIDELLERVENGEIIIPNNELSVNNPIQEQSNLFIFPNPARDIIYLKVNSAQQREYRIINSIGTVVAAGKFNDAMQEIKVAGLNNGLYLITISSETEIIVNRFIKY
ncbi:MAG: Ig-like domain-containing protein, partial [Bacteroidota bacterium]